MGYRFKNAKRNLREAFYNMDISDKKLIVWNIVKGGTALIGSAAANYVVGAIARNNLPVTGRKIDAVRGVIGIYLIEGIASAAVGDYINRTLSEYDFLFSPNSEEIKPDANTEEE